MKRTPIYTLALALLLLPQMGWAQDTPDPLEGRHGAAYVSVRLRRGGRDQPGQPPIRPRMWRSQGPCCP